MNSDRDLWDHRLAELAPSPPLLQSWSWAQVQRKSGWKSNYVHGAGFVASVLERKVGPVVEAYVPRGPVPATAEAIDGLVEVARGE
ncbi:MAG TPA: hypothetical protein VHO95_13295, partial [Candidatus Dormibacteraeota bacterium]|nr:hypothetical protein [Candidatus Dormibacteraeota bacterium]